MQCTINLMSITENIHTQVDKGNYCAGVFVDLKKPLIQSQYPTKKT